MVYFYIDNLTAQHFRYLTRMQMLQFVLVFLHSLQTLYYDCNYPKIVAKVNG